MERETKLDIIELTRALVGVILMTVLMLNGVIAYYPGEVIVENNTMGIENLVYTIINNESKVPNLYVDINKDNITIEFPQDMAPNSFDIVFIEEQTKEVVQIIRKKSKTKYVDRDVIVKDVVTKYIDRNITNTEYINLDENKNNESEVQSEESKSYAVQIISLLSILVILYLIYYSSKIRREEEIDDEELKKFDEELEREI